MSSKVKAAEVGRPSAFSNTAKLSINSAKAKSKLQKDSERRAIINKIVEWGGNSNIDKLNEYFGFETRPFVLGLINSGWLAVEMK